MQGQTGGRCSGTNKDGAPCSAPALPDRGWCAWHDPAMRERVAAGRVRGGQAKSNAARAKKRLPADVLTATEWQALVGVVAKGVLSQKLSPGIGQAIASLARAHRDLAELGRLEEQVAELDAMIRRRGTS